MKSHSLPNKNILDLLINTSNKCHILFIENKKKIKEKYS